MNRTKLKRLIFFSALFLFSMPASSAFYSPSDYYADEEEEVSTEFDDSNMRFNDPNLESDNSTNSFTLLGFDYGMDEPFEDFEIGAPEENQNAYNDVPLGNGIYILMSMIFIYAIILRIIKSKNCDVNSKLKT